MHLPTRVTLLFWYFLSLTLNRFKITVDYQLLVNEIISLAKEGSSQRSHLWSVIFCHSLDEYILLIEFGHEMVFHVEFEIVLISFDELLGSIIFIQWSEEFIIFDKYTVRHILPRSFKFEWTRCRWVKHLHLLFFELKPFLIGLYLCERIDSWCCALFVVLIVLVESLSTFMQFVRILRLYNFEDTFSWVASEPSWFWL